MFGQFRRAGFVGVLSLVFVATVGARCIENTSMRVDSNGYTHVYGEMYNDTAIQGHQLLLHGRLLGADGSVIAEHDAPICPPDLQPHSQSSFDIEFDSQYLPAASSFDVHAIGGAASDVPLPDAKIATTATSAYHDQGRVVLRIDVKNNSGVEYFNLNGCLAAYDVAGKVVAAHSSRLSNQNNAGTPTPGEGLGSKPDFILLPLSNPPSDAVALRGWVWIGDAATGNQKYQPVVTGLVSIP